jgi:hypothetical protein
MDSKVIEYISRDAATLVSYDKNRINFICKCGTAYNKTVKAICTTTGAFCRDCSQTNTAIKRLRKKIATNEALLLGN